MSVQEIKAVVVCERSYHQVLFKLKGKLTYAHQGAALGLESCRPGT